MEVGGILLLAGRANADVVSSSKTTETVTKNDTKAEKDITQVAVIENTKKSAENIQNITELDQRKVLNRTEDEELLEIRNITQGEKKFKQLSLNEILEFLGLKLSNVPGAGNCGPWALLHANDPKKRTNSGTYNKVNDEITLFDVMTLKKEASAISVEQRFSRAAAVSKDHECMSTDDLIYYAKALNKPIMCFSQCDGIIFVTLHTHNLDEEVLYCTSSKVNGGNIMATILSGYDNIKNKNLPTVKLQNVINKEFMNPIMIYIGSGHFQSVFPK